MPLYTVICLYQVERACREDAEAEVKAYSKHADLTTTVEAPINALIKTINQPLMALEALQAVATGKAAAPRIKK